MERYKNILDQLDEQAEHLSFPAFGAGCYYVDSRMSIFLDNVNWGILIETIEVNPNSIGHVRNANCVYRFGNYLCRPLGLKENHYYGITSDGDDGPVFGEYKHFDGDYLNPDVQTIRIRDHIVPVPHDANIYESKGIELHSKGKVYPAELLRALTPEYREYFFLSEEELQTEFVEPIPLILQLDEWRHTNISEGGILEKPSTCETFQLIAKVIATCDPNEYKPTEKLNTHWSNFMIDDMYI